MPTVAKNIKDAIAETEKNKNNLTKAKTKIDNKIQNLGGQKPTNIFDVANKIEGMVNTQFKKIAILNINKVLWPMGGGTGSKNVDFKINFTPIHAFAEVETTHDYVHCNAVISNHYSAYSNNGDRTYISASITSLSKTSCTIRESSGYGLKVLKLYLIG